MWVSRSTRKDSSDPGVTPLCAIEEYAGNAREFCRRRVGGAVPDIPDMQIRTCVKIFDGFEDWIWCRFTSVSIIPGYHSIEQVSPSRVFNFVQFVE